MHIVQLNYAYDAEISTPQDLLERYTTLTGWSEALLAAGASRATVVQRFHGVADVQRQGVDYRFCLTGRWGGARTLHRVVTDLQPDVVHVNGLSFPRQTWSLRRLLAPDTVLALQHHADGFHRDPLRRAVQRKGLHAADGFLFAARELAEPWRTAGLIGRRQPVFEVLAGSTHLRSQPKDTSRAATGLMGDPALLWVGRLTSLKDPLTVLSGFEQALERLPRAHLTMIYSTGELLADIDARLEASPRLRDRVHLLGPTPHAALRAYYSAADLFVLGSHRESTGFAAIEALACGAVPVVTDIPTFRVITAGGSLGALWPPGGPGAFATALISAASRDRTALGVKMATHFDDHLSWPAIGRQALAAYRDMMARRRVSLS